MLFWIFLALSLSDPNIASHTGKSAIVSSRPHEVIEAVMEKPGDPEKAVEAEYRALKGRGTREALELFIRRHADHPLAEQAREDIRRLGK
jgi:hypothetical protein